MGEVIKEREEKALYFNERTNQYVKFRRPDRWYKLTCKIPNPDAKSPFPKFTRKDCSSCVSPSDKKDLIEVEPEYLVQEYLSIKRRMTTPARRKAYEKLRSWIKDAL